MDGNGVSTSYVYDADGNRLLRREADGSRKLFADGTGLMRDGRTGAVTATRSYEWNGETVAVRTTRKVNWMTSDRHGTVGLSVDADTLAPTYRRTDPYGAYRTLSQGAATGMNVSGQGVMLTGAIPGSPVSTVTGFQNYSKPGYWTE